jgi:integrase
MRRVETHQLQNATMAVRYPLTGIPKANQKADPRRHRRAPTEAELGRLLDMARRRPVLDAATVHRGARKGEAVARLRPEIVARLEVLGRERALIYKTLVLTGLRKGELASLTVGPLELDGPTPSALLHAADEKKTPRLADCPTP